MSASSIRNASKSSSFRFIVNPASPLFAAARGAGAEPQKNPCVRPSLHTSTALLAGEHADAATSPENVDGKFYVETSDRLRSLPETAPRIQTERRRGIPVYKQPESPQKSALQEAMEGARSKRSAGTLVNADLPPYSGRTVRTSAATSRLRSRLPVRQQRRAGLRRT